MGPTHNATSRIPTTTGLVRRHGASNLPEYIETKQATLELTYRFFCHGLNREMGGVNENETRLSAITEALGSHTGVNLSATNAI